MFAFGLIVGMVFAFAVCLYVNRKWPELFGQVTDEAADWLGI